MPTSTLIAPQLGRTLEESPHVGSPRGLAPKVRKPLNPVKRRSSLELIAVCLGALVMAWPAFYNGFPLMYPDTLDYLPAGRRVAQALFRHQMSSYYGLQSLIYSLGIFPFHWETTVWPVIALQCLLASFVLWFVVRSFVPQKTISRFLTLMLLLSLFSSLSWSGSFPTPDILGPVLYLCIYLLVFARETISRVERYALYLISWWAIASNFTYVQVAIGLCFLLASLAIFPSDARRKRLIPAAELAGVILLALGAQAGLDAFLYSQSSDIVPPPFLTARLVGDGLGRRYLQSHCGETNWEICRYQNHLSGNSKDFLWKSSGVWMSATADSQKRIARQNLPLAIAILRTYPMEQFEQSAGDFWNQLMSFDLEASERHLVIENRIGKTLPRLQSQFLESRQAHDQLPRYFFSSIDYCVVIGSMLGIATLLPWLWRCRPVRILGLGFVIISALVLNALLTSERFMLENRFQSRVIWLVPLLAAMCALSWHASRSAAVSRHPKA
jgi:hypothetical protein